MLAHNVKSMGAELEGGWDTRPPDTSVYGDGSVCVRANHVGEIQTPGMTDFETFANWIRRNKPNHVGSSCGYHLHFKMTTLGAYMSLMEKDFQDFLLKKLTQFGKRVRLNAGHQFWYRLNGRNEYCKKEFHPDRQAEQITKGGIRYCQINFCYRLHGTIEVRVLPMFESAELLIGSAEVVLRAIEAYSRKRKHYEKLYDGKIQLRRDENGEGGETICV